MKLPLLYLLLFVSCKAGKTTESISHNKELLCKGKWILIGATSETFPNNISPRNLFSEYACRHDDTLIFGLDSILIIKSGINKCKNEADTTFMKWALNGGDSLILDSRSHYLNISKDSMNLVTTQIINNNKIISVLKYKNAD